MKKTGKTNMNIPCSKISCIKNPCWLAIILLFAFFAVGKLKVDAQTQNDNSWKISSPEHWQQNTADQTGLTIKNGFASPTKESGSFKSVLKRYASKRAASEIVVAQSSQWLNWDPIENIGPINLGDAPVMLCLGPDDYWMFGRYKKNVKNGNKSESSDFVPKSTKLDGFEIPLMTTRFANQYDAPGGLKKGLGGYHAWQSRDMVNWVHHGPITKAKAKWMTSAEFADGKAYFYYDFPNDQDPHVYVDSNLFDGLPGDDKGMAYADPTHGSDAGIIRSLDGEFHLILEDWTPINARTHAWDSPLAAHAVSPNGIDGFRAKSPPVDERTQATGKIQTYKHPHWVKEAPERFKTNLAEYEVHKPEQNAYGDWAAICIGGQYYLFCDVDKADSKKMSVGWFTSDDINKPFRWCGKIGEGHPDPDVIFAEGKFYLATQQKQDYVSTGPWVEEVQVRVGVDTDNDAAIDQWTDWNKVSESYAYIKGFSKQVAKTPAKLDLSKLPAGFGFQFEFKLKDTTNNHSKPMIDFVELKF